MATWLSFKRVRAFLTENWNLEVLVFKGRGKPKFPEKNLLEQRKGPTTTIKVPKISPRAYIFQRLILRGLFVEGLIFGRA